MKVADTEVERDCIVFIPTWVGSSGHVLSE